LYAAGNAADGDFSPDADDKIYSAEHVLTRIPIANEPGAAPLAFRLDAPFPNPVRTAATARYTLERPAEVEARLVDGRGRVVRGLERGARGAGVHTLRLAADGLPAGAYFLTLSTPEGTQARPVSVARWPGRPGVPGGWAAPCAAVRRAIRFKVAGAGGRYPAGRLYGG